MDRRGEVHLAHMRNDRSPRPRDGPGGRLGSSWHSEVQLFAGRIGVPRLARAKAALALVPDRSRKIDEGLAGLDAQQDELISGAGAYIVHYRGITADPTRPPTLTTPG